MNTQKLPIPKRLKYGEKTVVVRVPESMLPIVQEMLKRREVLETQWQAKLIGPDAQKLVDLIAELMVKPMQGMVKALEEKGSDRFHEGIKQLNEDIEQTRKACKLTSATALIAVLDS